MTTLPAISKASDRWRSREYIDGSIDARVSLTDSTKDQYRNEVKKAFVAGVDLASATSVALYAGSLRASSRAFLRAAIRTWTKQVQHDVKASATPDNMNQVGAMLHRLDALNDSIELERTKGTKAHFWLSEAEILRIMRAPRGRTAKRDRVVLGILLGAGLRREELANLTWRQIKRQGDRMVIEVFGKGKKKRVVPISVWLSNDLKAWREYCQAGDDDRVIRGLGAGGQLTDSLTAAQVFNIVRKHGRAIGYPTLAPHDMRRTFAQRGYEAGIPIGQLSILLGHSSIETTERYLNIQLDLDTTASDFVRW